MSDMPEKIAAWRFRPEKADEWVHGGWSEDHDHKTTSYIRADVSDAMVAANWEDAFEKGYDCGRGEIAYGPPADASAALDRIRQEAREEALREAAAACGKALAEVQNANPDRHDALPYIEDGCDACKEAIEALAQKDAE